MIEEKPMFLKDEEKDINLLISRIKKSPGLFKDRVLSKIDEFVMLFNEVKVNPTRKNPDFCLLCLFFAQIFEFYPRDLHVILDSMMNILVQLGDVLHSSIRYKIIQCLIIIKKKGFIDFLKSIEFFVDLFNLSDKSVRKIVFAHFIDYITSLSKNKKLSKIETKLIIAFQGFFETKPLLVVKRILKVLIRLYFKNVWTNTKVVNVIATQVGVKDQKISMIVAKFLISTTEQMFKEQNEEEEAESLSELTRKYGSKFKQSKKKIQKMERQVKNIKKKE